MPHVARTNIAAEIEVLESSAVPELLIAGVPGLLAFLVFTGTVVRQAIGTRADVEVLLAIQHLADGLPPRFFATGDEDRVRFHRSGFLWAGCRVPGAIMG